MLDRDGKFKTDILTLCRASKLQMFQNAALNRSSNQPDHMTTWGGHKEATKTVGVAHQKHNFPFYYTVAKYRLLEKYVK